MSRWLTVGAAQSGPVSRDETRADVVERLIVMLRAAHSADCQVVAFTEVALTAFFPHWWIEDEAELDAWFETEMPGPDTQPLFDEAARLGIGFQLGYAELAMEGGNKRRFNSSVLVGSDGTAIGKFRKMHLPGHVEQRPGNPFQNLEQRYFERGDLGFPAWDAFGGRVGMCICNDRRWPESWRMLALNGAELVFCGFNTPDHNPEYPQMDHLVAFHHQLCLQSAAYLNGMWIVGIAKAGVEEAVSQLGQTSIVAPSGQIVAQASTLGDELVVYRCDLDLSRESRRQFDFARNRRPEFYGQIAGDPDRNCL